MGMLLFITSALALEIQAYGTILSAPTDSRWFAGGIGAPTVDYDPLGAQWVMYFEGHTGAGAGSCDSVWSIGRATSPDGIDWAVDAEPVIQPDYTSPDQFCRTVQPTVVWDGSLWHMVYATGYRAQTNRVLLDRSGPLIHATSTDGVTWTTADQPYTPDPEVRSLVGLPSLTLVDDGLFLTYNDTIGAYLVYKPNDPAETDWGAPTPIEREDATGKAASVMSPSMGCVPDGAAPLEMFGVDEWEDGELFRSTSDDGLTWASSADDWISLGTFAPESLHHIEVLRMADSDEDVVLYYSVGDGTIGAAATQPTWTGTAPRGCFSAPEGPSEARAPLAAIEGSVDAVVAGCGGCSTSGASSVGGVLVGVGLLLGSRRR